jgi:endonuclease YncB( thermonuclease family)
MNRRPLAKTSWFTVLLLVAAVVIWALDQKRALDPHEKTKTRRVGKPSPAPQPEHPGDEAYEHHRGCTLVRANHNDGDSFMLKLSNGRTAEFRLYFVDTPESAFKSYRGGETNHERIRQQAADMGGVTPQQAVEIGKKAKAFTLALLEEAPCDIHTCWDSPFNDKRYHAFVEVKVNGRARWLHELLIERGLARIKTKPADLPDGTPAAKHRDRLRELERNAKRDGAGVWGL